MIKTDPIIAVNDVLQSSQWYQQLFNCKSIHGGSTFDVMVDEIGEVILCLHQWVEHEHPSMTNKEISVGNGLILYFRTDDLDRIRKNALNMNVPIEKEVTISPNSGKREFSIVDPDGYHLIISEYHSYQG